MSRSHKTEDVWPQRHVCVALLDKKLADGWTYEDMAKALKLRGTGSLEVSYRYDRKRMPSRPMIKRLAAFFGVPQGALDGSGDQEAVSLALEGLRQDANSIEGAFVRLALKGMDLNRLGEQQVAATASAAKATIRAIFIATVEMQAKR